MIVLATVCAVAFLLALGYCCNEIRMTMAVLRGETPSAATKVIIGSMRRFEWKAFKMGSEGR